MLKHISRILLGLTFCFSGFVKGIDPWGSAYKFADYFTAFHFPWLISLAFALGILLAATEFFLGVAFVCNFIIRFTSWLMLVFMLFFTGLTLIIALTNPVSDCGCFGDAIKITNWQTFYKNLVLVALAIIVFVNRHKFKRENRLDFSMASTALLMLVYFFLVFYSYNHLPIIDFSAYKVGVNIPADMKIPENTPKAIYKNEFVYKNTKTGKEKVFAEAEIPWKDTLNWRFIKAKAPVVIQEGYTPPIHDFRIETSEGEDVKDFYLYDEKYTFILTAPDLQKANKEGMKRAVALALAAKAKGYNFIALTASSPAGFDVFKNETGATFDFFNTDEVQLKTIVRSNPGLIILKKGTIIKKYHYNDIPKPDQIDETLK